MFFLDVPTALGFSDVVFYRGVARNCLTQVSTEGRENTVDVVMRSSFRTYKNPLAVITVKCLSKHLLISSLSSNKNSGTEIPRMQVSLSVEHRRP